MADKGSKPALVVPFIDDLHAPEVFASYAPFFSLNNGVVTITLAAARWDNSKTPGEQNMVTVGRLTMPLPGARGLATGLYNFLEKSGIHAVSPEEKEHMQ